VRWAAFRRALGLTIAALFPVALHAQAWLPEEGSFGVSILYSDVFDTKHYLPDGEEQDVGHMRFHSIGLTLSYSPWDRVLLTAGLPYVRSEYHGARPHRNPEGEILLVDDGDYHGFVTDLRVELHYQLLLEPVAFAPYVALVEPTHNYPSLGHASPGRDLKEKWVGFFIGKSLDLWIPSTYVQARYNFAFVEPVAGIGHDRSNLDFEVGYFVTARWSLRGLLFWQRTHGGIDVPVPGGPSNPLYPYHDQLAAEGFLNAGLGTSLYWSNGFSVSALYAKSLQGKNGHQLGRSVNLGLEYWITPR
jgi:hypothetical protein